MGIVGAVRSYCL